MPLPHETNGGQSALEIAAIRQRNILIPINTYNSEDRANSYTATHTRAMADQTTPNYGKGTGNYLDIHNYAAGSALDIHGNQSNAVGSGRNPAFGLNYATWGYDNQHDYKMPDMSKNKGQVII